MMFLFNQSCRGFGSEIFVTLALDNKRSYYVGRADEQLSADVDGGAWR